VRILGTGKNKGKCWLLSGVEVSFINGGEANYELNYSFDMFD